MSTQTKTYIKHHSFNTFFSSIGADIDFQKKRVLKILAGNSRFASGSQEEKIVTSAIKALSVDTSENVDFYLTPHIADELTRINDENVGRYIIHRYRYDVYPKHRVLDDYPPYLQIEPTSVCNYRCVFCYQTDRNFTNKVSGHMGTMTFDLFKEIIARVVGKVEFLSLASRGEPLLCKDISRMLEHCAGKFLGLKLNTNASILTEAHCHAILAGGVNTVVFSADAATDSLYGQFRVRGNLQKVLANIKRFQSIRRKHYPQSRIITRVSGVKFSDEQDMDSMVSLWGDLVDQVSFVAYNAWENVYELPLSEIMTPCSDLWRRMFIWYDGTANPCDVDYKSTLSPGNVQEKSIPEIWQSDIYKKLRERNIGNQRDSINPCRRCAVI